MNAADDLQRLTRELARSTAMLRSALSGLDNDALNRRPARGEWSAWDIAYHIVQLEVWYLAKLCEATTRQPSQAMERFVQLWLEMRARALSMAAELAPDRCDAEGLLTGVPDWTPRRLLERMADHDREHAAQARAARALPD
jgi:uncharacterized damage-inducible protein DinB